MIRLAGVKAVRYMGTKAKKLWEVGGRNVPVLERGDIVLVGEAVAISLVRGGRRGMFELVEGAITIDVPALPEIVEEEVIDLDETQEGENPPADLEAEAKAAEEAAKAEAEANMTSGTEPLVEENPKPKTTKKGK